MRAMLSQPMAEKTDEEIVNTREKQHNIRQIEDVKLLIHYLQTNGVQNK